VTSEIDYVSWHFEKAIKMEGVGELVILKLDNCTSFFVFLSFFFFSYLFIIE